MCRSAPRQFPDRTGIEKPSPRTWPTRRSSSIQVRIEISSDSMLWQVWNQDYLEAEQNKRDVKPASVHYSYTEFCTRVKSKDGSTAWIRTAITVSNVECVSCRVFNGLKRRIGLEKPSLVHNSYTAWNLRGPLWSARISC